MTLTSWQSSWHMPCVLQWESLGDRTLLFPQQSSFAWTSSDMSASFRTWSGVAGKEFLGALAPYVNIPKNCSGRGQTLDVCSCPSSLVPIAPGRHGDVKPRSSLLGRLVRCWFQQLRRLQAYVRRASSASRSPALQADQCCMKNTLSARRFSPDFSKWWSHREVQLHGSLVAIPLQPSLTGCGPCSFHGL